MKTTRWLAAAAIAVVCGVAPAGDWNQWRGPDRNGVATDSLVR